MTKTRTIDNSDRPARPEPGEDEAVHIPRVREQAREVRVSRHEAEHGDGRERDEEPPTVFR